MRQGSLAEGQTLFWFVDRFFPLLDAILFESSYPKAIFLVFRVTIACVFLGGNAAAITTKTAAGSVDTGRATMRVPAVFHSSRGSQLHLSLGLEVPIAFRDRDPYAIGSFGL